MNRVRYERRLTRCASRRGVLAGGVGLAALSTTLSLPGRPTRGFAARQGATPAASVSFAVNPFSLGVASGDPLPDGVVLWTRLAPEPLADGGLGGLVGQGAIQVTWEITEDEAFGSVVQDGTSTASEELGFSVHVDVTGLEPGREYYYRFMAGSEVSPVGRTRTAPAAGAAVDALRFAFASCSMWEHGWFNAYRDMANADLALVLHLGDYIYEYEATGYAIPEGPVRTVQGPETLTLEDYRNRHALYKTDLDLQAAHAAVPWIVTWDDHETENDYAALLSENGDPAEAFALRRANAYQAYYEHLPIRLAQLPQGPDMLLYRRIRYGDLVEFNVLDTRQYRTDHPCGDGVQISCPAGRNPDVTLLGPDQERWLLEGLSDSRATWNVMAQQIMAAAVDRQAGLGQKYGQDSWNGYPAARDRIFGHILAYEIPNPIVITGDVHALWVNELKSDFNDPESATVGAEFVGSSISSNGDEDPADDPLRELVPENPHVKFLDGTRRGYVRCEVTPTHWRADLRAVESVRSRDAAIDNLATFVVQAGRPGIDPA